MPEPPAASSGRQLIFTLGKIRMKVLFALFSVFVILILAIICYGFYDMQSKAKYIELKLENNSLQDIVKIIITADKIKKCEFDHLAPRATLI